MNDEAKVRNPNKVGEVIRKLPEEDTKKVPKPSRVRVFNPDFRGDEFWINHPGKPNFPLPVEPSLDPPKETPPVKKTKRSS
jgi:hypothetical protein